MLKIALLVNLFDGRHTHTAPHPNAHEHLHAFSQPYAPSEQVAKESFWM